jgi:hypothetical protein
MMLALVWQATVRLALLGKGQPAYYLNFLAPALGAAVGMGLGACWRHRAFRRTVTGGMAYTFLLGVGIFWAQVMLFSGLKVWYGSAGGRAYSAPAVVDHAPQLQDALERVAVLAYPDLAAAAWVVGSGLLSVGLVYAWKAACGLEGRNQPPAFES